MANAPPIPCLGRLCQPHRLLGVIYHASAAIEQLARCNSAVAGQSHHAVQHPVGSTTYNRSQNRNKSDASKTKEYQVSTQTIDVDCIFQYPTSLLRSHDESRRLVQHDGKQLQHTIPHFRQHSSHKDNQQQSCRINVRQDAANHLWRPKENSCSPPNQSAPSFPHCVISSRSWSRSEKFTSSYLQQQQRRGFFSSGSSAAVPLQASLIEELQRAIQADESQSQLTPAAVVERLDKVIVGQQDAKKAVAIAFRNRWRRQRVVDVEMRGEITPKNLLLMGPTGCGKTEIARRLAKLAEAPFIKVEATKFTEVGYHGRDVDSIIRDLVEVAQTTVKQRCKRAAAKKISEAVESHILHLLLGESASHEAIAEARERYRAGELEDARVEIEVPLSKTPGGDNGGFTIQSGSMSVNVVSMFGPGGFSSKGKEKRTMSVGEARPHLEEMETERQFPPELIMKEAIRVAEQEGIVFIDEIDKIVNPSGMLRHGSDPSAEGVQRDLLPLIEGSVVSTKHGPVATDHMLFIASGAFTSSKPSDMMAELQGRLPIRVELKGLSAEDFKKILTEPECNMLFQQQQLLGCEGVDLVFTPEAIKEIAAMAEQINKEVENIGARRLHTVLERLVEDISFEAPDKVAAAGGDAAATTDNVDGGSTESNTSSSEAANHVYVHVIDKKDVQEKLADLLKKQDLDKYIL